MTDCATDILISVKKEYAARILTGEKTVELRRRPVNVAPGSRIWIYTKMPYAEISLFATVKDVMVANPSKLWKEHGQVVGITRLEFDRYLKGTSRACGIVLSNVHLITPALGLSELRSQSSSFHPPQFFKRLSQSDNTLELLRARAASSPQG